MSKYTMVTVQALSAEPGLTKNGKEQYAVRLKIVSGPQEHIGREMTEYMSISGKASPYTKDKLRALGWKCKSPTDMDGIGRLRAEAGIFNETYEGQSQEKISVFAPPKGLDDKAKKTFGSAFKAEIAKAKVIEATDANRALEELPEQVYVAPADEEELPF